VEGRVVPDLSELMHEAELRALERLRRPRLTAPDASLE
jgi:hypothetical protein